MKKLSKKEGLYITNLHACKSHLQNIIKLVFICLIKIQSKNFEFWQLKCHLSDDMIRKPVFLYRYMYFKFDSVVFFFHFRSSSWQRFSFKSLRLWGWQRFKVYKNRAAGMPSPECTCGRWWDTVPEFLRFHLRGVCLYHGLPGWSSVWIWHR